MNFLLKIVKRGQLTSFILNLKGLTTYNLHGIKIHNFEISEFAYLYFEIIKIN